MQHTIFYRKGLIVILALSCVLFGCNVPTETIETSVEVPEEGEPEIAPEITGFTFTQVNPLRASQSGNGAIVGSFRDPIGGMSPFTYFLVRGARGYGQLALCDRRRVTQNTIRAFGSRYVFCLFRSNGQRRVALCSYCTNHHYPGPCRFSSGDPDC